MPIGLSKDLKYPLIWLRTDPQIRIGECITLSCGQPHKLQALSHGPLSSRYTYSNLKFGSNSLFFPTFLQIQHCPSADRRRKSPLARLRSGEDQALQADDHPGSGATHSKTKSWGKNHWAQSKGKKTYEWKLWMSFFIINDIFIC